MTDDLQLRLGEGLRLVGDVRAGRTPKPETIQERFALFHAEHPEVYRALVRFTREAVASGLARVGMKMVWERVRWYVVIERRSAADPWKLNNDFHSRYARLIMAQEQDLADVFETREIRTA